MSDSPEVMAAYYMEQKRSEMRESVKMFAELMEKKLKENDHKGGWGHEQYGYFCTKLHETILKLTVQRFEHDPDWIKVIEDSIDLANYAMMASEYASKQINNDGTLRCR